MKLALDSALLKISVAVGMSVIPAVMIPGQSALAAGLTQIDGVLIPQTFSMALREGMSIPLLLHFEQNSTLKDDQRIGRALLVLDDNHLKISEITLEDNEGGAQLTAAITKQLNALNDANFDDKQRITLSDDAWLALDFRQLNLQLVVKQSPGDGIA